MDTGPSAPRRAWQTETEWFKLLERITVDDVDVRHRRQSHRRWMWVGAAAGVVLLLGAAAVGSSRWRNRRPVLATITTPPGQRLIVSLADKSTITLGPASTLHYDQSGRSREVTLDGLADFRVQHDPAHPFVVHAGGADVADLGTEFVVRAYGVDSTVHIAVNTGIVSVKNRAGDRGELTVHAGEVALVHGVSAPLQVREVNAAAFTGWIGGTMVFDDDAFSDVARELGRWFDVDIRLADPRLATRRISAIYNNPSLSSVLEALTVTLGARYEQAGRTITFTATVK
jgi:transmembrane sensor